MEIKRGLEEMRDERNIEMTINLEMIFRENANGESRIGFAKLFLDLLVTKLTS
jgi:hypothetical protein